MSFSQSTYDFLYGCPEEMVQDLFIPEDRDGYCYLQLIPEYYRQAAALRYGERPDWFAIAEEVWNDFIEEPGFQNFSTQYVQFCNWHTSYVAHLDRYVSRWHVDEKEFSMFNWENIQSIKSPISRFYSVMGFPREIHGKQHEMIIGSMIDFENIKRQIIYFVEEIRFDGLLRTYFKKILFPLLEQIDAHDVPLVMESPLDYTDEALSQNEFYCYLLLIPFSKRRIFAFLFRELAVTQSLIYSIISYYRLQHSTDYKILDYGIERQMGIDYSILHLEKRQSKKELLQQFYDVSNEGIMVLGTTMMKRPLVSISKEIISELKEAGISKDAHINKLTSKFAQGLANAAINFPYQVDQYEYNLLNDELNGILVPTNRTRKSHGVVKFVDYYHKLHIASNFNKGDVVLFMGAKLREVVDAIIVEPSITPVVVYGFLDAADKDRHEENLRFAVRFLDRIQAGDGNYYAFGGIQDQYIKSYESIPVKVKSLLQEFIHFYNKKKNLYHYDVDQIKKYRGKINIMQLTNVYDITPREVAYYMRKFHIQFAYLTRIACLDLFKTGYSLNESLGVEFRRIGRKISMNFSRSSGKGYVHDAANVEAWNVFTKFRTRNGLLNYEVEDEIFHYELCKLSISDLPDLDKVCLKKNQNMSYIRLFEVMPYLKYGQVRYFFVDRRKFYRILDYCNRVSAENFDPTKIMTMATSIKNELRVGDATVQQMWDVDQVTFFETIQFCVIYASLRKGEMIDLIIESIQLSKLGGYHPWVSNSIFKSIKRFMHGLWEPAKLKNKFDAIMRAPDTFYWEEGKKYNISARVTSILNKLKYGDLFSDHEDHNLRLMFQDMEDSVVTNRIFKFAADMVNYFVKAVDLWYRIVRTITKFSVIISLKPLDLIIENFVCEGYKLHFKFLIDDFLDKKELVVSYMQRKLGDLYIKYKEIILEELYGEASLSSVSETTYERTLRYLNGVDDSYDLIDETVASETTETTESSEASSSTNKSDSTQTSFDDDDDDQKFIYPISEEQAESVASVEEFHYEPSSSSKFPSTRNVSLDFLSTRNVENHQERKEKGKVRFQFQLNNEQYFTPTDLAKKFCQFVNEHYQISDKTSILDACAGYGALGKEFLPLTKRISAVEIDTQVQYHPNFEVQLEWHFRDILKHNDFNYDIVIANPPFGANQDNKMNARAIFKKMFNNFKKRFAFIQQPEQIEYYIENYLNRDHYDYYKSPVHQFRISKLYSHHSQDEKSIPVQFLYIIRKTSLMDLKGLRSGKRSARSKTTGQISLKKSTNIFQQMNIPYGRSTISLMEKKLN